MAREVETRDPLVVEIVDVMHGADEGADEAALLERSERVARDSVLRVVNVEAAIPGKREMRDIVLDALLDHRECFGGRGPDGEGARLALGCAEEAFALCVRRMQHDLAAKLGQRLRDMHRVHDAAARIGGMGEHGDADGAFHPAISATRESPRSRSRRKSRRTARRPPETSATSLPLRTPPMTLAWMSRP